MDCNKKVVEISKKITSNSSFYDGYDWEDWSRLPILDKKTVVDNFSSIISSCPGNKYVVNRTSGSSGLILTIPWFEHESMFTLKQIWQLRKKYNVFVDDIYVTCHAHYYKADRLIDNKIIVNKNCHSFSKLYMTDADLSLYANYMIEIQPSWLLLQPSVAYALGQYLFNNNIRINSLKYIELTGEQLTNDILTSIKHYFYNIPITNNYGMQEFYYITFGNESVNELEILDNNVFVEIIDSENNPAELGSEGRILVTGLQNSCFPLIRYETGDRGRLFFNDNKYILELTESRANDIFIYKGNRYDASIFFNAIEYLNMYNYNIRQFQCCYIKNTLHLKLFSTTNQSSPQEIIKILSEYFSKKFNIIFDDIILEWSNAFITSPSNNKLKYFINKNL